MSSHHNEYKRNIRKLKRKERIEWILANLRDIPIMIGDAIKAAAIIVGEIITGKSLRKVMAQERVRNAMVAYVDHVHNIVCFSDLEKGGYTTVQGTGIADEVKTGLELYA